MPDRMKEEAALKRARETGFIRLFGSDACRRRLSHAWALHCRARDLPYLEAYTYFTYRPRKAEDRFRIALRGSWGNTNSLLAALKKALVDEEQLYGCDDELSIDQVKVTHLDRRAHDILDVIHRHRPVGEERYEQPARLVRGMFVCLETDGFEDFLEEGESYYIREIAGMSWRVTVYIPNRPPLVGIRLERFDYTPPWR